MTVSYALTVSSVSFCAFLKLLRKWKGSILKAVWAELLVWLALYTLIALVINLAFDEPTVQKIGKEVHRLNEQLQGLDLKFMLGFFVTIVVDRWKTILMNITFIETVALSVSTLIRGTDDNVRLARRSIIRYLVLAQIMVYRDISMRCRRRFPTMASLVESGFLFENELRELEHTENMKSFPKYWVPINWSNSIVWRMQEQKYIEAPVSTNNVLNNIRDYRAQLENLCKFDWVPIPIAYPQVVFLAVRLYFFMSLFTRQYIPLKSTENCTISAVSPENAEMLNSTSTLSPFRSEIEYSWFRYIPLVPAMSFIFYVGWMKVAEALLNPFGEDDDDFEGNWVIDKNITTGMQIVDGSHSDCPDLNIDRFADPKFGPMYPILLQNPTNFLKGSAEEVVIPETETSRMVHVDSQSSVVSAAGKERQSSIRRRFQRLSSKLKLGRTTSAPKPTVKSPGGESFHSQFGDLTLVAEENEDPRADLRLDMENSEIGKK